MHPDFCSGGRCGENMPSWTATRTVVTDISRNISGHCPRDPEGTADADRQYGFVQKLSRYGCQRILERNKKGAPSKYLFFYDGTAGSDFACFLYPGEKKCGLYCDANCTHCETILNADCIPSSAEDLCADENNLAKCPACAVEKQEIMKNGKRQCKCKATDVVSNNRCCGAGMEYINGACQKGNCTATQCMNVYGCMDETARVRRKSEKESSCVCWLNEALDPNSCYDEIEKDCIPIGFVAGSNNSILASANAVGRCVYSCVQEDQVYENGICKNKT